MKILVLPSWYPPRGGEFFREHSLALAALGHEVTVLAAIQTSLGQHGIAAWLWGKDIVNRSDEQDTPSHVKKGGSANSNSRRNGEQGLPFGNIDNPDAPEHDNIPVAGGGSEGSSILELDRLGTDDSHEHYIQGGGSFTEVYSHYRTIPLLYRTNIVGWIRHLTREVQLWIGRNGSPGLIQVHSSIWAGVVAARIGRQYNIPYVVTEHRSRFVCNTPEAEQMFRPWHHPLLQEAFSGAARIITVSDALQQKITEIMKGDSRTTTNHPATPRHDHATMQSGHAMPMGEPGIAPGDHGSAIGEPGIAPDNHGSSIGEPGASGIEHGMPGVGPENIQGHPTLGKEKHITTQGLPITTIPNMVDTGYFCPAPAEKDKPVEPFVFFSLAFLEPVKGFDNLISAFNILNSKFPHRFRLVIGGDGSQRQVLGAMVARLGLQAVVTFTGGLTREEVRRYYRSSHAFVLASRFEAFGVVFIEAMACGIPVIATRSGGPETFIGPDSGMLVNADCPEELAAAMEEMAGNYAAYNPEHIRLQTINHFSRQAIARKYGDIYKVVLDEQPK